MDIASLLFNETKNQCCVFDNHRVELKKRANFIYAALSMEMEEGLAPFMFMD